MGAGRWAGGVAIAVAVADTALAGSAGPWARRARRVTKPALVPAITVAVRASGGRPSRGLGLALAGSWAGDVALLSRSDAGLLGGIGGFAVAHVAYLAEIRRCTPVPAGRALAAGGTLFVLSDGLVAASLFGPRRRVVDAAVMATYATAQALLAAALADRS